MSCKLPYGESCGLLRGMSRKRKPLIWASAREVWKWKVLFSCVLALPETEAPHLGVSSGGVEVEGTVSRVYLTKPLSLFGPINIASDAVRPNQAIIASFAVLAQSSHHGSVASGNGEIPGAGLPGVMGGSGAAIGNGN